MDSFLKLNSMRSVVHFECSFLEEHQLCVAEIRVIVSKIHYFSSTGIPPVEEIIDNLFHSCPSQDLLDPEAVNTAISSLLANVGHPVVNDVVFWRNAISSCTHEAASQAHESGGGSFNLLAKIKIVCRDELVGGNRRGIPWQLLRPAEEIDTVLYSVGDAVPRSRASPAEKLERVKFVGGGVSDSDQTIASECVICLDEFVLGSELIKMPCCHLFHETCLIGWLERSRVCPLCRVSLPEEAEDHHD